MILNLSFQFSVLSFKFGDLALRIFRLGSEARRNLGNHTGGMRLGGAGAMRWKILKEEELELQDPGAMRLAGVVYRGSKTLSKNPSRQSLVREQSERKRAAQGEREREREREREKEKERKRHSRLPHTKIDVPPDFPKSVLIQTMLYHLISSNRFLYQN